MRDEALINRLIANVIPFDCAAHHLCLIMHAEDLP